jgi:hypothetical protein
VRGSWKSELGDSTSISGGKKTTARPLHQFHPLSTLTPLALSRKASSTSLSANADHDSDVQSDAEDQRELIRSMKRLTVLDKRPDDKANRVLDAAFRFHGKSINYNLVSDTREMKTRYLLESMGVNVDTMTNELDRARAHNHAQALEGGLRRQVYWRSPEVSICSLSAAMALPLLGCNTEPWCGTFELPLSDALRLQWEIIYEGATTSPETFSGLLQHWPPSDLSKALIDLYFLHCNNMFPLLHRPTFLRHVEHMLYERDIWFACTCMSVFALASRYTNDVRVLLDEPVDTPLDEHAEHSQWQTAGFKYYSPILGKLVVFRVILKSSAPHRSAEEKTGHHKPCEPL